jgi:protocatechuate 3,4-dioxygenase alpha subunit
MLYMTPSQTVGPYLRIGFDWQDNGNLLRHASSDDPGRIEIQGRLLDGAGVPVSDAVIEIWQADSQGRFGPTCANHDPASRRPAFLGFGRCCTDSDGCFRFITVKPGAVSAEESFSGSAPHLIVQIFMRGILKALHTRLYFPDSRNEEDPVFQCVPASRRTTLVATPNSSDGYTWNIHLQGDAETVFFDI